MVIVSIDVPDKAAPGSDLAADVNVSEVVGFVNRNRMRLFIYLTAGVPLSLIKERRKDIKREGRKPLS